MPRNISRRTTSSTEGFWKGNNGPYDLDQMKAFNITDVDTLMSEYTYVGDDAVNMIGQLVKHINNRVKPETAIYKAVFEALGYPEAEKMAKKITIEGEDAGTVMAACSGRSLVVKANGREYATIQEFITDLNGRTDAGRDAMLANISIALVRDDDDTVEKEMQISDLLSNRNNSVAALPDGGNAGIIAGGSVGTLCFLTDDDKVKLDRSSNNVASVYTVSNGGLTVIMSKDIATKQLDVDIKGHTAVDEDSLLCMKMQKRGLKERLTLFKGGKPRK